MTERIRRAGAVAWAVVGIVVMLAIVGYGAWFLRVIFPPLVLAGAIVFILNPVVTRFQQRGIPRAAGTALSYLGVLGLLFLVGLLVAPLVQHQAEDLSEQYPELRKDVERSIDDLSVRSKKNNWIVEIPSVKEIEDQIGAGDSDGFLLEFNRVIGEASTELEASNDDVVAADLDRIAAETRSRLPRERGIAERFSQVREIGQRIFEVGLIFILAPIIAFYLLVDIPRLKEIAEDLIPEASNAEVHLVAHRLSAAIGGYFRGQLFVAFIVGVIASIGLAIVGLPFWLIIGMIAGLFNIIPLIGPWIGAVPGVIIALTTGGGIGTAIWVVVVMAGAQQIDNHFISPMVMQRTVKLHPAAVMLALLAGGTIGGFFGLLLAVPVTAVLKIVIGHLWHTYVLGEPIEAVAEEAEREDTRPGIGMVEDVVGEAEEAKGRVASITSPSSPST